MVNENILEIKASCLACMTGNFSRLCFKVAGKASTLVFNGMQKQWEEVKAILYPKLENSLSVYLLVRILSSKMLEEPGLLAEHRYWSTWSTCPLPICQIYPDSVFIACFFLSIIKKKLYFNFSFRVWGFRGQSRTKECAAVGVEIATNNEYWNIRSHAMSWSVIIVTTARGSMTLSRGL